MTFSPPGEILGGLLRSGTLKQTDRAHPPADAAALRAEALDMLSGARNPYEARMTAEIHQIRDYQLKRAVERAHKELEKEAVKILREVDTSPSEMIPYHRDNEPA